MENLQQLFIEAGTLMLAGMVFVFTFLALLIVFINVVLVKLAKKYPDASVETRSSSKRNSKTGAKQVSPAVVAAITSAVTQYRQQHSAQK
ncbi:MAG: OadG family protein [Cognaticolwellia sp.]